MDESEDKLGNLDTFLGSVDEIYNVIKGMNADDTKEKEQAIEKADELLMLKSKSAKADKTGVNRTVINKTTSVEDSVADVPLPTDQESFMRAVELDAKQRAERKQKNKQEASKLKDEGNKYFKDGNFLEAIDLYTSALEKTKDYKELWTNRAQAYLKLGRYEEASSDCDWAIRVQENYAKAYALKGKAFLGLSKYADAKESYNKAKECDPKQEKIISEYIHELEVSEQSQGQEEQARQLFGSGARHPTTFVEVLNKVKAEGECALYYDGGSRVLADMIRDENCQTLFRTEHGLSMLEDHPFFTRVFSPNTDCLSREELDACTSMFLLLLRATERNEHAQKLLLSTHDFAPKVMKFLNPTFHRRKLELRESCLNLLLSFSETETGRKQMAAQLDVSRLLLFLGQLILSGGKISSRCTSIMNNMVLDTRFKKCLRSSVETLIPSFEKLLESHFEEETIAAALSIVVNLCADEKIRHQISSRDQLFDALLNCLEKLPKKDETQIRYVCLGLLMNLTIDPSSCLTSFAARLVDTCLPLMTLTVAPDVQERAVGLLSHILHRSTDATNRFLSSELGVVCLLQLLEQGKYSCYTVKALTACTQVSQPIRKRIGNSSKAVNRLSQLLNEANEALVGNVCLCLSHCVSEPGVVGAITKDTLKRLLVLVREANNHAVKQNCAILMGKLATAHPMHLEYLRELDGIGILHNNMKYVKP